MGKGIKLALVLVLLAALAAAGIAWEAHRRFNAPGPLAEDAAVVIAKGSGLDAVARKLETAGIIADRRLFAIGARLAGAPLKAGEFAFPARVSPRQALAIIAEGRTVIHKLTLPEGLSVRQALEIIQGAEFLAGPITVRPQEGALLPETYHLSRDDARDEVIGRMEKAMRQTLDQLWDRRQAGLPLKSKAEAVVLASIVERETGLASERPRVAAVFINRLRLGMRLQSDPTVIYGVSNRLGVLDRPLSRRDLETEHPWNTYTIAALPPTPIANPGRASLEAVLDPPQTKDLYFVADGTGGHVFAQTLDQHNRNVANWRQVERQRGER